MKSTRNRVFATLATALGATLAASATSTTFTWTGEGNADWDTSALNWNDGTGGGKAWVDNAAEPNNAIFPASSSQTTVNVVGDHVVSNLTINATYNHNGSGKIAVAGTVLIGAGQTAIRAPLASGRADGPTCCLNRRVKCCGY